MKKYITVLAQVLAWVPRGLFQGLVDAHQGDYRVRTLRCWDQFAALFYGLLSGRESLRELEAAVRFHQPRLCCVDLGQICRSTLADANERRPTQIYWELFRYLYGHCRALAPGHGFRFKNPLYALDATVIDLCLDLFPWAEFKQSKGAIKLHMVLDLCGQIPSFVDLTPGRVHEINQARKLNFEPGSILVFDRGYVDYAWFHYLILNGNFFVTRLKKHVHYKVLERRPVDRQTGVTSDQIILIKGTKADQIPTPLRRVRYVDPETGKAYVFLTCIFHLAASTIASIYKARWQIETFFRWIKQHLKIKTFFGASRNAVLTQIWIAMCVYLLLAYLRFRSRTSMSMHHLIRLLEVAILVKVPLEEILEGDPPAVEDPPMHHAA